MQTVLIPTDFNKAALDCIPNICHQFPAQRLRFVFVHLFKLSDSISDLLMLSRRSREYDYVSDNFHEELIALQQQFLQIDSVRIEFFYGNTMSMFRDFLETQQITHVLDPSCCRMSRLNRSSIDPAPLLARCGLPLVSLVDMPAATTGTFEINKEQLAEAI
ncbi:hypothetical protein C7T94_07740 [Pedobacter yulinensis]|uniref:Universal stress protein n=1 Tax=Pedobacter yulinensis TaxID=2126353 RepID=A0A2T3HJD8_9SPHI|nr:hypothetical protein [Pedobacter yulinensis]PST82554.1 hypothetical protein C7T94_07740 [Pedobacter yulinensis]